MGRGGLQQTMLRLAQLADPSGQPSQRAEQRQAVDPATGPRGVHVASRYAAVRSAVPPEEGGGMRPQQARAARLKPSAASCSSGLPVA